MNAFAAAALPWCGSRTRRVPGVGDLGPPGAAM